MQYGFGIRKCFSLCFKSVSRHVALPFIDPLRCTVNEKVYLDPLRGLPIRVGIPRAYPKLDSVCKLADLYAKWLQFVRNRLTLRMQDDICIRTHFVTLLDSARGSWMQKGRKTSKDPTLPHLSKCLVCLHSYLVRTHLHLENLSSSRGPPGS